jgi:hypothetical protein
VPNDSPYNTPELLAGTLNFLLMHSGKRIATTFANISTSYFHSLDPTGKTQIRFISGSVEAACSLGIADGIVDLVESGETMRASDNRNASNEKRISFFCKIMQHLEEGDPDAAISELSLLPASPETLELLAHAHFALFSLSEAQTCLEKAIRMEPKSGHSKYLLLAQILGGKESLSCLSTALLLIPAQDLRVQSSTYAAIAELYMTGKFIYVINLI